MTRGVLVLGYKLLGWVGGWVHESLVAHSNRLDLLYHPIQPTYLPGCAVFW